MPGACLKAAAVGVAVFLGVGALLASGRGPAAVPDSGPYAAITLVAQATCPDPRNANDPYCRNPYDRPSGDPPPDLGNNPGSGGVCTFTRLTGEVVTFSCHQRWGWYDGDRCFWTTNYPDPFGPPAEPPPGEDPATGAWYYCIRAGDLFYDEAGVLQMWQDMVFIQDWFTYVDLPVVTPEQVAQSWLAEIPLYGVEFQLAPPPTGRGLVHLPGWLGVDQRNPSAWGPIPDSHCIQTVCVTIEAVVASVDWQLGDGSTVTCVRDQHMTWDPGMDYLQPGGNCHHYYQRSSRNEPGGKYEITATSNWEVRWTSPGGLSGTIETTRESTVALQIDEVQVLVQ